MDSFRLGPANVEILVGNEIESRAYPKTMPEFNRLENPLLEDKNLIFEVVVTYSK